MENLRSDLASIITDATTLLASVDQVDLDQLVPLCNKMSAFNSDYAPKTCPVTGEPTIKVVEVEGIRMGQETALQYLQGHIDLSQHKAEKGSAPSDPPTLVVMPTEDSQCPRERLPTHRRSARH